jgi:uncharacterized membrane protein
MSYKKWRNRSAPPVPNQPQRNFNEQDLKRIVVQTMRAQIFQGPLPPPNVLSEYDKISPGFAERIMKMAEEQGSHRRECEKAALHGDLKNAFRGSWFAFILGVLAIVSGTVLYLFGKDLPGFSTFIAGLGTIILAFIVGARQRRKERVQKYGAGNAPKQ